MSLQLWLPLNGNLKNMGVCNTPIPTTAVTYADGGKIGDKCLKSGTKVTYNLSNGNIFTHSMTVSFWGKSDTYTGTSTQWWQICSFNCNDGSVFHIYCVPNVRYKMEYKPELNVYCDTDVWHHITYVLQDTKLTAYVDGVQTAQATVTNDLRTLTSVKLGVNTVSVNDFRIYDHCLTAKEIRLLSKGLIAHFTLDGQELESTTNLVTYPTPTGNASYAWDASLHQNAIAVKGWSAGYNSGVSTNGVKNPEVGYHACWKLIDNIPTIVFQNLNYDINLGRRWLGISGGGALQTLIGPSQTYTVSFDAKSSVPGMVVSSGFYYKITGATGNSFHDGQKSFTLNTSWQRYSYTLTTRADLNTAASASLYMYGHNGTVTGVSYVRNIQIELKDHATAYTPSTRTATLSDASGYGHHGTIVGNAQTSSDGARYSNCMYLSDGRTNYGKSGIIQMPTDSITMNCWFKSTATGYSNYHIVLSAQSSAHEMSIDASGKLRTGFTIGGSRVVNNATNTSVLDGEWHMLTTTYDGTAIRRYVDGVEAGGTTTASGSLSGANVALLIGNYNGTTYGIKEGYISDVRIYATALNADDIADLYNTRISFLTDGTISAYKLEEVAEKIQFGQNGNLYTNNFSEYRSIADMPIKVLEDGSAWARIHWLDVSNIKTVFANNDEVANCTHSNRYSRMEYVDMFVDKDGCYEFMLTYPRLSTTLYNRWKQTNSPNVAANAGTGYEAITTAWSTHANPLTKCASSGSAVYCTNTKNNWWSPIGQLVLYNDTGIPAANGSTETEVELWVRIDNLQTLTKISFVDEKYLQASNIYEF